MSEHSDLKKIGHLYQTDKIDHGYLEIYENYFNKLQNKNLTILEMINMNEIASKAAAISGAYRASGA